MKKLMIAALVLLAALAAQRADGQIVVDSEKVFKSVKAYNDALKTLEDLATKYDKEIEDAYAKVEQLYNQYQQDKLYLSAADRQKREDAILDQEQKAVQRQEELMGPQGELFAKRVELITPIQERVFGTINDYAARSGHKVVIDIASNPSILYYSPDADKTGEIIDLLK